MADASNGTGLREHLIVFSRFLRSPRTVGALSASSRALARAVVDVANLADGSRVVELGPGTGALTSAIVERLSATSRFLAVDIDPEFVRQIGLRWPTVECLCASAEHLHDLLRDRSLLPVDHIISGLPFTSLPAPMTARILENVETSLRPGGSFTTFQYVYAYAMPSAVAFRRDMNARMGSRPSRRVVMRNVPPAYVLNWTKPAATAVQG
jgi:phospholipid N-methyltransferase